MKRMKRGYVSWWWKCSPVWNRKIAEWSSDIPSGSRSIFELRARFWFQQNVLVILRRLVSKKLRKVVIWNSKSAKSLSCYQADCRDTFVELSNQLASRSRLSWAHILKPTERNINFRPISPKSFINPSIARTSPILLQFAFWDLIDVYSRQDC